MSFIQYIIDTINGKKETEMPNHCKIRRGGLKSYYRTDKLSTTKVNNSISICQQHWEENPPKCSNRVTSNVRKDECTT